MTRPVMPNEYPPGSPAFAPAPDDALADALRLAGVEVDTSDAGRADHGRDWWPLTIPRRRGRPGAALAGAGGPTGVERTRSPPILTLARRHGVAVTAQGGRSGVVGGAVAPDGAVALDLTAMNRVLDVDESSGLVTSRRAASDPTSRPRRALGA